MLTYLLLRVPMLAHAQTPPDWTEPFPPHRVVANVYYVGSNGLASYLTTPQGHILINSSMRDYQPVWRIRSRMSSL